MTHIEIFKGKDKRWYYHLKGRNGERMSVSEGYLTKWGAGRGARRFQKVASEAQIVQRRSE